MKATLSLTNQRLALTAICLTALLFGLEISSIPVILPTLQRLLHASFSQTQWIMNAYTIACTAVLIATGSLSDRYGRKRIYLVSIAIFGITSITCGLAQSVAILIAGRFLQGLSGGAMLICQIANLSHQFREGTQRAKAFGAWGIVFGAGLGCGPIIGGVILALSNWKWVFLIHGPISLTALFFAVSGITESRDPRPKGFDAPGMVLLTLAVFGLTYFITQAPDIGFTSYYAIGIIVATILCFLLFLWFEKTSPDALFDFSIFRVRNFSGALFGAMGMNFSFWPFIVYLPIYFQTGLGYDAITAGASILAYTLPTLVVPPVAERLSLRYQPRVVIPSGLFIIGLGFFLMKIGAGLSLPGWLSTLPGSLIAGIGLGVTNTPVTNTTTGSVAPSRAGMASGIDMSARLITLAVNIAIMGFILVKGIVSSLTDNLPRKLSSQELQALAEKIAEGHTLVPATGGMRLDAGVVHAAIVHGFGLLMLYAGIGVWSLAAISWATFGRSTSRDPIKDARA